MEASFPHGWRGSFLRGAGQRVSFPDAIQDRLHWSSLLYELNAGPEDTIACVLPRSVDLASIVVCCWTRGIRCASLNPTWPSSRLQALLKTISPVVTITSSGQTRDFVNGITLDDLKHGATRIPDYPTTTRLDLGSTIVSTSGSTAEPRLVVHSRRSWRCVADLARQTLNLEPGDTWLLSLPLYHVSGISTLFRCLYSGVTVRVPKIDEDLLASIQRYSFTHISLVATQLYRLLRDEKSATALSKCKAVVMGGGPTPEGLVREAVARGIKLVMSYGMTETAAMICCTRPGDPVERLLSSGRPLVEGTVSISDEGEILVRGDQLFMGYLQPDGLLHRPLTEDGWFRTGDRGHFDGAGYLHVTGRRDNMFISGGENIQPEEIEAALCVIAGVEEAIVVPVDDAEWGKRPVAFVRMGEGRGLDVAAIEASLRKALPGYKIPRTIHAWPVDLVQPGLKPALRDFERRAKDLATN